jgi:hypothetical protein
VPVFQELAADALRRTYTCVDVVEEMEERRGKSLIRSFKI